MKKIISICIVALIISTLFTGCGKKIEKVVKNNVPLDGSPSIQINWITPSVVTIGNYYMGAEADSYIKIYNSGIVTDQFKVTNDPHEVVANIPITEQLYGDDIANVQSITSDIIGEDLVATAYYVDDKGQPQLTIKGFRSDSKRLVTITYKKKLPTQFSIIATTPDNVTEGYSKIAIQDGWFTILNNSPIIASGTATEIPISFNIPKDTKINADKIEFWITVKAAGQHGNVDIELNQSWRIGLR